MNQLQMMREIADRIGVDEREAALGIKLARTGRMDLISAVASGRMTIRAALARASREPASATPDQCRWTMRKEKVSW
jgi:hypothetical protein